jgi:hypothetical protein
MTPNPSASSDKSVEQLTSAGMCAFVDLLGFSEQVLNASSFADIARVRACLDVARKQFEFNAPDSLTQETHALYGKRVLAVSDSIVTYIPLDSEAVQYSGDFDTLFSEMTSLATAQGALVVNSDIFVRGAVDLGWWFEEPDTVLSDAFVRAYKLETAVGMPVIAVGEALYNHLVSHEGRRAYSAEIEPVGQVLRRYEGTYWDKGVERPLVIHYLDYMGVCLRELNWWRDATDVARYNSTPPGEARQKLMDDGYAANIRQWLRLHAEAIRGGHADAPPSAQGKYVWLARYHNEIAEAQVGDDSCNCVLA